MRNNIKRFIIDNLHKILKKNQIKKYMNDIF